MRPSVRLVAVVGLALAAVTARPVHALPDPFEAGLLAKISATLEAIEELRMRVMARFQEVIDTTVNVAAFPDRLFDPIQATITGVGDVRRELQHIGCDWPMSERAESVRKLILRRLVLCRGDYQGVWGSHEGLWDGPLQETNDFIATLTANMLSERAEKTNSSWVLAHRDLFREHTIARNSPGEANRAEAAALAWANEVAIGNGQITAQSLLVRQMDRSLDRFDQKKAADLTYYLYRGVTTLKGHSWIGAPPDPTETLP